MSKWTQKEIINFVKREADEVFRVQRKGEIVLQHYDWKYVENYPVNKFLSVRSPNKYWLQVSHKGWIKWWKRESGYSGGRPSRKDYYSRLENYYVKDPSSFNPIIVVELPNGKIDIGDGWHRAAIAVKNNLKTIPAIVGTKKRNMNKIQAQTAKRLLALAGSLLKTSGFSKRKIREAISNYLGDNLSFFEVSDKPILVGDDHEWWYKGDKFFEVTIKDSSGRPVVFHYNPTAHQLLDVREDDVEKDPITVR